MVSTTPPTEAGRLSGAVRLKYHFQQVLRPAVRRLITVLGGKLQQSFFFFSTERDRKNSFSSVRTPRERERERDRDRDRETERDRERERERERVCVFAHARLLS